MKNFVINGKFLAQRVTGVQRVAREILPRLDELLDDSLKVELVVPADAKDIPVLRKINVVRSKYKKSIVWEQFWLPLYILKKRAVGIHLCHVAPILKPDIVCIHDANVLKNPQWFTRRVVLWYNLLHRFCGKFSKKVLTDSEFSKQELYETLGIPLEKIQVFSFGYQHLDSIVSDSVALDRYGLEKGKFYFSLGTRAPHKNLKWVFEYAKIHPKEIFAVSGSSDGVIFGKVTSSIPENVKFLGYLSDEEIKALMQNCKAFVFPSFYEGFGIPPLEAMSCGCPVVVSDIPVMHEIFGNAAHYINPNCVDVDMNQLLMENREASFNVLQKYSWRKTARVVLNMVKLFV